MKSDALDKAFKNEGHVRVRKRLSLIIRTLSGKQHVEPLSLELHKLREWAYKWSKGYNDEGPVNLIDKPGNGRPSFVGGWEIVKIKHKLSSSNTGWDTKEVMAMFKRKQGQNTMKTISAIDCFSSGDFHSKCLVKRASGKD